MILSCTSKLLCTFSLSHILNMDGTFILLYDIRRTCFYVHSLNSADTCLDLILMSSVSTEALSAELHWIYLVI